MGVVLHSFEKNSLLRAPFLSRSKGGGPKIKTISARWTSVEYWWVKRVCHVFDPNKGTKAVKDVKF